MGLLPLLLAATAWAASPDAPPPERYFNDQAGFVSPADAQRLDEKLRRFDEQSSNQIVVAIFPELPSPSMEDFTVRTAQAWRVGRQKLDNGLILFVFVKDRKLRIEVGYGLEGAVPDALAKRIIDETIVPRLRQGDPATGLEAGIDALIAATRGEYKTERRLRSRPPGALGVGFLLFLVVLMLVLSRLRRAASWSYDHNGWRRRGGWGGGWGAGGGWSGGGWGGGGGGDSGGGGFSGGGGSFGGGGASGGW
jgi:uncharacterized protein